MSLNFPEFLIPPFGPNGGSQLMNYDIIEFPEEGNTKSSNQREFPSLKSGRGQMVSTQEQETLQLRALKLQTPIKGLIKGTFPLSSFTLRSDLTSERKCIGHNWPLTADLTGLAMELNCIPIRDGHSCPEFLILRF